LRWKRKGGTNKFEIASEYQDLHLTKLWLDNIIITDLDTAQVHENSVYEDATCLEDPGLLNGTVKVFPNPVVDILNIKMNRNFPFSFILYDLTGKNIFEKNAVNEANIDLSGYESGLYFLKIIRKDNFFHSVKIYKR
jgi:hypothetical protein